MSIKVSIIVPSYKRDVRMFSRAIKSLLAQTYQDIEIIIVDDNASEALVGYRQELSSYIKTLNSEKIVYIQNVENLGGSLSRNEGIKIATGDYIAFLDDDDRYLPCKIEHQLKYMLDNNLDMSFTNLIVCNDRDDIVDCREYFKCKKFDTISLMKYHLTHQIAGTDTFMYRKEVLRKIGGFVKVSMGQEYYLMFNTIKSECQIGYAPYYDTILYREGQECISTGINKINGQKSLFKFKKENYNYLTWRERVYVRFRHHVVMSVAYKRNGNFFKAIAEAMVALFSSPIDSIMEFISFFERRKRMSAEVKR